MDKIDIFLYNSLLMYRLLSKISLIVRFAICYFTIEAIPIFQSELWTVIFAQTVPVYSILLAISYAIVGGVFKYERGSFPELGVFLYFIVYIPLVLLLWGILALLTALGTLPIA